ncbi:type III polyketide synthase [Guptibacillus hwajinpoensis]|uniref:type III polyketide synthase n=1 Tax=Guptibacillus hwajinpoensis TaxID=208199 RepID=UPI001CFEBBA3|nr:3-oxoacyl-[acyl-carrier-protein] synthase III C-terminal domain-containing protein [Pseudalkalibacillus hwajinpoensis]WLR60332.1 3-oxoacyl-[acyl-carrier-protein] synthase III C-terminal domain-containing protein [Pseudalkalibacillus hwajinpoensis]
MILSIGKSLPPHCLLQTEAATFAKRQFGPHFKNIDRLLPVFQSAEIDKRYFAMPLEWYSSGPTFEEKNEKYVSLSVEYAKEAVLDCLNNPFYLNEMIDCRDIDAIFFVSTTGISTPSIEARIMNVLPFSPHTKRIPIWGLGCAGGAAGIARANDYCLAHPDQAVLVVNVELCSLTFQHGDFSKSNLIGTALFADGISAVLLTGESSSLLRRSTLPSIPGIVATRSTLMRDSEDVMGWEVSNEGLHVVFSKSIPAIVSSWLEPNVLEFLSIHEKTTQEIDYFIAHPGGTKVLTAYEEALGFDKSMTAISRNVLKEYGNMSSVTVIYVLDQFLRNGCKHGHLGLMAALGPGFCSELLLLEWKEGA